MENNLVNNDPLESILVDSKTKLSRTKELLATILKPFAEIDRESGELNILPESYDLTNEDLIIVFLCGRLAQNLLEKLPSGQDEKLSQKEIIKALQTIPSGSIKAGLKRLRDNHFIKNEEGRNFVEFQHLERISRRFPLSQKKE